MHGFPKAESAFGEQKEKRIEPEIGRMLRNWKQMGGRFLPFGSAN